MLFIPGYVIRFLNKYVGAILFILFPCFCEAQLVDGLLFKHLDQESGLSDPNIKALHTDREGFLWIGTENGLNRFDGTRCVTYKKHGPKSDNYPGSYITNIIEDRNGDLIIGSQQNLVRYDKKHETFSRYAFKGKPAFSYNHYSFPFHIDQDNKLWVYIAGNVYTYDRTSRKLRYFTTYSNGYIFTPLPMFKRLDWFVSRGVKGIYISKTSDVEEKNFKAFFTGQGSVKGVTANVQDAYLASDFAFWLACEHGLIELNPKNGVYKSYNSFNGRTNIVATAVKKYPNKPWLIVGTSREGILFFDLRSKTFFAQQKHNPVDPHSLSGNNIRKLHIDDRDHLFVAVEGKGLDFGNLHQVVFPSLPPLKPEKAFGITSMLRCASGEILCGTRNNGLIRYSKNMDTVLSNLIPNTEIRRLSHLSQAGIIVEMADGNTWLYHDNTARLTPLKLQTDGALPVQFQINQFIRFNGHPYAATGEGLAELQPGKGHLTFSINKQFNRTLDWPNIQQIIPISPDSLLVQTYYTALYLYTFRNNRFFKVREICRTPYAINQSTRVKNVIYLATTQGLFKVDATKPAEPVRLLEHNANGLVYFKGAIWTAGNSGLFKYEISNQKVVHFNRRDGLKNISFAPQTLLLLQGKLMAIGGENGINLFNPETITPYQHAVQPKIVELMVNDVRYRDAGNPLLCEKIVLAASQSTLSIAFSTMDYIAPEKRHIRYRMIGYDKSMISHFGNGLIRYPNMPAGNYRFELIDVVSGKKNTLIVQILAPFWQRWWFIGVVIGVLVLLSALLLWIYLNWINRLQSSQLRKMINFQKSDRKRIADELHDDLGLKLSSLKHYLIAGDINKMINGGMLRSLATEYIDGAMDVLRNTLTNLNPKTLDQEGLILALEDLFASISRSPLLKIHFDHGSFSNALLSTQEYALYRICQELLNNTLKHAGARNIYLSIVTFPNSTVLLYEDDGKGFKYEMVKRGYGLYNIEAYVKAIRADLDIQSVNGKGMAVTIIVEHKNKKR